MSLLKLEGVFAGYGPALVLQDISFELGPRRALAVLGRNGVGKTTLVNTIVGQTRMRGGRVLFDGQDVTRMASERRARAGIGWVPQERNIFRSLTVEENLTAVARPGPWSVARVYEIFPRLKERRRNLGNQLSGGEQQMLAIARALVLNARLLLLDEPFEGLAPIIIRELAAVLSGIIGEAGQGAVIVEQNARKVLAMTDEAVILDRGTIVHAAPSRALLDDPAVLARWLGVSAGAAG